MSLERSRLPCPSPRRVRSSETTRGGRVESIAPEDVPRASEIEEQHRIAFRDALIVAAAVKGGATRLLSEDLNDGQVIAGVVVENPFR